MSANTNGNFWTGKVHDLLSDWLSQYITPELRTQLPTPVDVVASPDVDGVLSIVLLQRWLQNTTGQNFAIRVAAIYTTTDLFFLGESDESHLKRALWIDHDVLGNCRSIGNHLTQMRPHDKLPFQHGKSFNPNKNAGVAFSNAFRGIGASERDKYPFGTAHLLAHALFGDELNRFVEKQPYHSLFTWLAHADGAWLTAQMYRQSALQWFHDEFESADWMKFLFDDYLRNELRLEKHSALTNSLALALGSFLQRSSSASLQSDKFLESTGNAGWKVCRGHQGMTNCTRWDVEKFNLDWLPSFRKMLALVQVSFGGPSNNNVLPLANANLVWRGDVKKPNPSDLLAANVSMPAILRENKAFSIAFVSRRMVRYTVNLPFY